MEVPLSDGSVCAAGHHLMRKSAEPRCCDLPPVTCKGQLRQVRSTGETVCRDNFSSHSPAEGADSM